MGGLVVQEQSLGAVVLEEQEQMLEEEEAVFQFDENRGNEGSATKLAKYNNFPQQCILTGLGINQNNPVPSSTNLNVSDGHL